MSKTRVFVLYWLPVLLWMAVIFSASGDMDSFNRSSRIIRPIVQWLLPDLSEKATGNVVFVARKCAHLTEYAILAMLFWRAVRRPLKGDRRPWSWRLAGQSVIFVALYAATDELHQQFVPNRYGSIWDVLLDTIGAAGGMLLLRVLWWWRRRHALAATESIHCREAARPE